MNKTQLFISSFMVFVFLGFSFQINAQEEIDTPAEFNTEWSKEQRELISSKLTPFPENTQISVSIIKGDITKYLGVKKEGDEWIDVDNSAKVFEIGSITKVFTSTLFAQALSQGDVQADTYVDQILGYSLRDNKKITLLELSNHTSGLSRMPMNFMFAQQIDQENPYIHYKEPLLKDWLTKYMDTQTKEVKSEYSNLGAGLLGHALSLTYEKSYQDLLKENIFTPLGMESSTTNLTEVEHILVKGLNSEGSEVKNWTWDVLEGAGAILSTVKDLGLYAKAVMDKKDAALNLQRESTFVINENFEMAMGWHIFQKDGNTLYWHNGGTSGYCSSLLIDVNNNRAIVLLSNISAFHSNMGNVDQIVFDLMQSLNK